MTKTRFNEVITDYKFKVSESGTLLSISVRHDLLCRLKYYCAFTIIVTGPPRWGAGGGANCPGHFLNRAPTWEREPKIELVL